MERGERFTQSRSWQYFGHYSIKFGQEKRKLEAFESRECPGGKQLCQSRPESRSKLAGCLICSRTRRFPYRGFLVIFAQGCYKGMEPSSDSRKPKIRKCFPTELKHNNTKLDVTESTNPLVISGAQSKLCACNCLKIHPPHRTSSQTKHCLPTLTRFRLARVSPLPTETACAFTLLQEPNDYTNNAYVFELPDTPQAIHKVLAKTLASSLQDKSTLLMLQSLSITYLKATHDSCTNVFVVASLFNTPIEYVSTLAAFYVRGFMS